MSVTVLLSYLPSLADPLRYIPMSCSISNPKPKKPKPSLLNLTPNDSTDPPKTLLRLHSATTTTTPTVNHTLDFSFYSEGPIRLPNSNSNSNSNSKPALNMSTTPPWIRKDVSGSIQPDQVSVPSKSKSKPSERKINSDSSGSGGDRALTDKVSGVRGKKAMKGIVRRIARLQEANQKSSVDTQKNVGQSDLGLAPGRYGGDGESEAGGKMPWSKAEGMVFQREKRKKDKMLTVAEVALDGELLERLRGEAKRMRKWVKVKKAGVTQAVVDEVHLIWRRNELAMLKFDVPLCWNMIRAHEIVEIKTGGLIVWNKKDALVVYRGCSYQSASKTSNKQASFLRLEQQKLDDNITITDGGSYVDMSRGKREKSLLPTEKSMQSASGSLYEREADRLLDGLGPRFIDWWRPKPLPVDADLLPEVVPEFRPPVRLCAPHARSKLNDDELTYFRKLARSLPTHFVLGRNRKLQGLAVAILKLWEKCHVAKIAVKWGIPDVKNEQMACELKQLIGGVLLLRNKFYIIIYRGHDFLPCNVANLIEDREKEIKRCQLHEEATRLKADESFYVTDGPPADSGTSGTFSEFQNIYEKHGNHQNGHWEVEVQWEVKKQRLDNELRKQERKLFILKKKIEKSSKALLKLNSAWKPAGLDLDQELITEEERECFHRIGLRMSSRLLLGRRGIFEGVVEGLHQHWKFREVVKVITKQKLYSRAIYTAKSLEAESGGILVSVDKLKVGYAIIIYRGKNYRRPPKSMPRTLLTKRKALFKSLELQRIGSLKFFAYQRQRAISELRNKLADLPEGTELDPREPSGLTQESHQK